MPDLTAYPEVTDWLGEEIARLKNQVRQANAEVQHLERRVKTQDTTIGRMSNEIERLRAELATALDDCNKLYEAKRDLFREFGKVVAERDELKADNKGLRDRLYYANADAARAEAAVDKVMKRLGTALALAEAQRDTARAAIERARAEHTDDGAGACETCSNEDPTGLHDYREPMPCPTLRALGYPEKGAESHGDGRTPQTQGASEAQEANGAHGGSQ